MIEFGQWYKFNSQEDKKDFLGKAAIMAEKLGLEGFKFEEDMNRFLKYEALMLAENGHLRYRSKADNEYNSENLKYQIYVKGDNKMAICTVQIEDELIQKYLDRELGKINENEEKQKKEIRMNSDVAKSIESFYKLMDEREIKVMFSITDEMLSEEDRAKLDKISTDATEKRAKAIDKAFECDKLLKKAQTLIEYKGILDIYGYIQEAPKHEGK